MLSGAVAPGWVSQDKLVQGGQPGKVQFTWTPMEGNKNDHVSPHIGGYQGPDLEPGLGGCLKVGRDSTHGAQLGIA